LLLYTEEQQRHTIYLVFTICKHIDIEIQVADDIDGVLVPLGPTSPHNMSRKEVLSVWELAPRVKVLDSLLVLVRFFTSPPRTPRAFVRPMARLNKVQHEAKTENVRGPCGFAALVVGVQEGWSREGQAVDAYFLANGAAKVADANVQRVLRGLVDQEVLGANIAVDDAPAVDEPEALDHLTTPFREVGTAGRAVVVKIILKIAVACFSQEQAVAVCLPPMIPGIVLVTRWHIHR
jgi:hypothetical protein